jgi:hypothetical protein
MSFQEPLVFVASKLTAAIRVQRDWASIRALPKCHQDGLEYELGVLASTLDQPNHTTGGQVQHDRQVEPAFRGSDLRDVRDPLRVELIRAEVSSQVVLKLIGSSPRWLYSPASSLRDAAKAIASHQTSDAVAAACLAQEPQLVPHARTAEYPVAFRMKASDTHEQPLARLRRLAGRSRQP